MFLLALPNAKYDRGVAVTNFVGKSSLKTYMRNVPPRAISSELYSLHQKRVQQLRAYAKVDGKKRDRAWRREKERDRRGNAKKSANKAKISPDVFLSTARAALAETAAECGVELVGVILTREPTSTTRGGLKMWIDAELGINGTQLNDVSTRLKDALWARVDGKPTISVLTPGRTRPLFSADDFERFSGLRARVTLKVATVDGRRRLLGKILGVDRDDDADHSPYVVVHDESANAPVRVPFASIQLGDKSTLLPLNANQGPIAMGKGGKIPGEKLAAAAVDSEIAKAPIVVFIKSYCPYCRRALKVLRDAGVDAGDPKLHLVALEDREDMVALQQNLRIRTGASTVPRAFLANGNNYDAEQLEELAARPGQVESQIIEAQRAHERRQCSEERIELSGEALPIMTIICAAISSCIFVSSVVIGAERYFAHAAVAAEREPLICD